MIKRDPKKSFEIMGAYVKQTGEAFEKSAAYLRWQDRAANLKFLTGEHAAFSKEAAELLMEAGIIKALPDMSSWPTRVLEVTGHVIAGLTRNPCQVSPHSTRRGMDAGSSPA